MSPAANPAAAAPPASSRLHGHLAALVSRPAFWLVFVVLGVAIPIARSVNTPLPPPLPVLGRIDHFQLMDQYGQAFSEKNLEGQVWVGNFIFTRCPTICPTFTKKMGEIQHRGRNLGQYFHLVTFTVDPENDTVEKLRAYAEAHRVSPRMWSFLTGPRPELEQLIIGQMKVGMEKGENPDDLMSIGHGSHFVLVDAKMQIRGYYQFDDPQALDSILRDAGLLAARGE
jgi:protein SCO1